MAPDRLRVPALTDAECSFVDHYLAIVDLVARVNPANSKGHTYATLQAAQALVGEARSLLSAVELMWQRGEREIHVGTLTRALRALDGDRRAARVALRG